MDNEQTSDEALARLAKKHGISEEELKRWTEDDSDSRSLDELLASAKPESEEVDGTTLYRDENGKARPIDQAAVEKLPMDKYAEWREKVDQESHIGPEGQWSSYDKPTPPPPGSIEEKIHQMSVEELAAFKQTPEGIAYYENTGSWIETQWGEQL